MLALSIGQGGILRCHMATNVLLPTSQHGQASAGIGKSPLPSAEQRRDLKNKNTAVCKRGDTLLQINPQCALRCAGVGSSSAAAVI